MGWCFLVGTSSPEVQVGPATPGKTTVPPLTPTTVSTVSPRAGSNGGTTGTNDAAEHEFGAWRIIPGLVSG